MYILELQSRHSQNIPLLVFSYLSQFLHNLTLLPSLRAWLDIIISAGPIVDVPIWLIQQLVVLVQFLSSHVSKIQLCKITQQQVSFQNAPFPALV